VLRILQVLVGLMALLFLGLALNFLFNPLGGAAQFAVQPEGILGLNSIRGDFGGLFLGGAILLIVGLLRREGAWLLAVAVLMGSIALGRLLGFVLDGFAGNNLPAFILEVVFVAVLVQASRVFASSK
jgi:hypothetical protein